jgi:hypothetical protein
MKSYESRLAEQSAKVDDIVAFVKASTGNPPSVLTRAAVLRPSGYREYVRCLSPDGMIYAVEIGEFNPRTMLLADTV